MIIEYAVNTPLVEIVETAAPTVIEITQKTVSVEIIQTSPVVKVEFSEVAAAGPPGIQGPPAPFYQHIQSSASATWSIAHNLGYRPNVALFTAGGVSFDAEIVHTTLNNVIVYLSIPMSGSARCT